MNKDIIGVDVTVEYADGEKATGHLSPIGVHIAKDQPRARLRPVLELMRKGIEDAFRPYRSMR